MRLRAFARRRPLHVVETRGFPWIEIDFPEDYWRACAEVMPAINDLDAAAGIHARERRARATNELGGSHVMYERFYNLRERPFNLSPDPDYFYPSRVHTEALNYLRYGIEGHAGFVVITGDIGSGKTTLLQTTLRGIDRRTSVARLVSTMLDARELIEAVMLDFGLDPPPGRSKPYLLRDLARFLVDQRRAGRLALLVVDEAQNLQPDRARRDPDAVESRNRKIEADSDRAGRPAQPARRARPRRSSSSCGSGSRCVITSGRSIRARRRPTSTTGCARRRSARRWSFRARSPI